MSRQANRKAKKADPFYKTKEWEVVRKAALKRDNWRCQDCGCKCLGKRYNQPAPNVDHIIPRKDDPRLALVLTNLRTLCAPCHSKRTGTQRMRDVPEIGLDGYPLG